jgi:hypothetical protein
MLGRFLPIICALVIALASMVLAADPAAPTSNAGQAPVADTGPLLVLLRNGEYLTGQVTHDKERYLVEADGTQIRLAKRDVDFVCRSLDEAYTIQRDRIPASRVDDRVRLTNWCLQHRLLGYAATELAAVIEANPRHPSIATLDRRLQQAIEQGRKPEAPVAQTAKPQTLAPIVPDAPHTAVPIAPDSTSPLTSIPPPAEQSDPSVPPRPAKPRVPVSSAELDRFSRNLPNGTVEHFIETIQPILMNSCSTVGCHGPASKSQYSLIRPAANGRITPRGTSQRNLFNTIEWLDHKRPSDSELLTKAREPHGGKPVAMLAENTIQYQQLAAWVRIATGSKAEPTGPATIDMNSPGTRAQVSPFQPSPPAPYVTNPPAQPEQQKPIEMPADEKPFYEEPPRSVYDRTPKPPANGN